MKYILRVPMQDQYSYTEIICDSREEYDLAKSEYLIYKSILRPTHTPATLWTKVQTFTGETILYNEQEHKYAKLDGTPLLSGSEYAKRLEKEFDIDTIAPRIAKSNKISEEDLRDMWKRNGEISTGFGTTIHKCMEQWFKHRSHGTEKNYHLPKHPFLKNLIQTFPQKDKNILPELMVSAVDNGMVGQIDGLLILGENTGEIIDYKTDMDIEKNLQKHFNQLSFYAHILMSHGWSIPRLSVWNYNGEWNEFTSDVKEINL